MAPAGATSPEAAPRCTRWWVDLSVPAPAPGATPAERVAQLARVDALQAEVLAALQALGAVELGRVRLVRNALAVALPAARVAPARAVPGVVRLRPLVHRHRPHAADGDEGSDADPDPAR